MIMSRPMVTVLMAVYNGEQYLRHAVESILNQTLRDFEFLIVNDGSTDASRHILLELDDPRVRLIENNRNFGLTKSLNNGIQAASGRYVARQDADDISEPKRLATQVEYMETHPAVAAVGSWCREIDAYGRVVGKMRLPTDANELRWSLLFMCPFIHSGMIMRREIFQNQIGLYDEGFKYAQDHELWLRASRRHTLTNIDSYLVRYRWHSQSMTSTYGDLTNEGLELSTKTVANLLGWQKERGHSSESNFRKMFSVLYEREVLASSTEIEETVQQIWELFHAFCKAYSIGAFELDRLKRMLIRRLSERYVRIAARKLEAGQLAEACELYDRGLKTNRRALLTRKSARVAGNLLLRRPGAAIRSILGIG